MINKAALNAVVNGTKEERRYLCEKDFGLFFTYYFVDYVKYPYAPFHIDMFKDIKDLLEADLRELVWVMFRESAKTSIAKGLICYLICYKKRFYINVDAFDKVNAERILFDIVTELQTNPRLIQDYGQLFNAKRTQEVVTQRRISDFVTTNGIRVEAHSTQESVRGRLHKHQRPDFLLLDDFETNKTRDSEAYTLQIKEHIDEFKSGLDSKAKIIYLGNYITEYGNVEALRIRALDDARIRYHQVNVIADNQPTWPDKYTMTDAELLEAPHKISLEDKKRQLGSQVFNTEMMNSPIDAESQEFFHSKFKRISQDEVDKMEVRKFVTIDTALSKKETADATGITFAYVDAKNRWYINCQEYRVNSKGLIDLIFQFHDAGAEKIGIETTSYTEAIKPFFEDECRRRNVYPYIIELKHGGTKKETRIRGLIPRYEAGDIYHIENKCTALEEQLIRFPRGLHDDCADSLAYLLQIAQPVFPKRRIYEEDSKPLYPDIGI